MPDLNPPNPNSPPESEKGPGDPFFSVVSRKPVKVCNVKADQNPGTQVLAACLECLRTDPLVVYRLTPKLILTRIF